MEKLQDFENFVKEAKDKEVTAELLTEFLTKYKSLLEEYLAGNITDVQLSDATAYWFATEDKFSDNLEAFKPGVENLKYVMDITHPDFDKAKKQDIIENAIKKIEELLK